MMNAGQYISLMQHALGKTPDSRHDLWATFNRAGRALVTRRTWSWRTSSVTELPVVASQDYVDLPSDFGGVLQAWIPQNGSYLQLRLVTLADIARYRATDLVNVAVGQFLIHFPVWKTQDSAETPPTPRAFVWPIPTANASPTINFIYRRRWVNIAANDDARVPNIPEEFEQALVLLTRSFAWHLENQSPTQEDTDYEVEIKRLEDEDDTIQSEVGMLTGGVDTRVQRLYPPSRYPTRASL